MPVPTASAPSITGMIRFDHTIMLAEEEQFTVRARMLARVPAGTRATVRALRVSQGYTPGRGQKQPSDIEPDGNFLSAQRQSRAIFVLCELRADWEGGDGRVLYPDYSIAYLEPEEREQVEALMLKYPIPVRAHLTFQ